MGWGRGWLLEALVLEEVYGGEDAGGTERLGTSAFPATRWLRSVVSALGSLDGSARAP